MGSVPHWLDFKKGDKNGMLADANIIHFFRLEYCSLKYILKSDWSTRREPVHLVSCTVLYYPKPYLQ